MFGIGGLNPVSLMATAALGPMGGVVAQLATQVFSQMGQQLIQQMGQQLNLPQSAIDMAQGRFATRAGDFQGGATNFHDAIEQLGRETNASPSDIGSAQRDAQDQIQQLLNDLAKDHKTKEAKEGGGRGGAPGWLEAMAEVLGQKLDDLAHDMQDLAGKVNKEDPSTSTDFTVASQQFNMLMEASSTALKTIGEAMGKMAGRQ